ncbi:YHS domain-containing protein [Spirosoma humi]
MKRTIRYALCGLGLTVFSVAFVQDPVVKKSGKKPAHSPTPNAIQKPFALASTVDPVCKMSLSSGVVDMAAYAGKQYGFCSKMCKDRFRQRPAAYVR